MTAAAVNLTRTRAVKWCVLGTISASIT